MQTRVAPGEALKSSTDLGSGEKTPDPSERALEIQQSIAVRAYQLFESRGRVDGYDLKDWLQAESEVLLPISTKTYEFEDEWITRAQLLRSTTDDLDVKVEPKQIIISDRGAQSVDTQVDSNRCKRVFHRVLLPEPVDWASAAVTFKDGILQVAVPKLQPNRR